MFQWVKTQWRKLESKEKLDALRVERIVLLDMFFRWVTALTSYSWKFWCCMRNHTPLLLWCVVEGANELLNDRHPERRTAGFMRSLCVKILLINCFLAKYPNKNYNDIPREYSNNRFFKEISSINCMTRLKPHWLTVRIAQEAVDLCMQSLKEARYKTATTEDERSKTAENRHDLEMDTQIDIWIAVFVLDVE